MNENTLLLPESPVLSNQEDIALERIPDAIYDHMVDLFANEYHFNNGERMMLSNYFVKISRSLSDEFTAFIREMTNGLSADQYPAIQTPLGFKPASENLLESELNGGFSLGSFDMAVTQEGLRNIEFQSVATYPVSAAKLNQCLLDHIKNDDAYIFADSPQTDWKDFIKLYDQIIGGNEKEGIVLTDRQLEEQKTNFEFFATQKELNVPIDTVDLKRIFEKEGKLFYTTPHKTTPQKITRLYNRILLAEALFEDNYPDNHELWKFRFDKKYESLKFVNHPIKQFEVSKRLSPYVQHSFNPDCYELSEVADQFIRGDLACHDFVWKHKWGAAGHRLILSPDISDLVEMSDVLEDYIAQKKVTYKTFKTDDGQEKIVELRFMTAVHDQKTIIVPMARLGHVTKDSQGNPQFKIHFGDNNKKGYGFSPVIMVDDKA